MPPIFPTLMVSLAVSAFFIKDYFLLEVISVALCFVAATIWLSKNSSKYDWITSLINKNTERITWVIYTIIAGFSLINPAVAGGTGASGCAASNTILGPIADALLSVFQSSAQVGSTGEIAENICQVFVTFAAIIALLVIGTSLWGLFDNQVRGSDLGKAFTPLGLILAGTVISRIGMKLIMGV
jgi:heme/copper-type cytochrome/quinol oxidase subunit 4